MTTAMSASEALSGSTISQINAAAPGIIDTLNSACASAMKDYLDGMQDFTGDYVNNVSRSDCKGCFEGIFQFRNYEDENHPAIAQAAADAAWASMFPFTFDIAIPPPGGATEANATSLSATPLGSIAAAYDTWDEDGFSNAIADAVEEGAEAIQVGINYFLAATGNPPAYITGGVS